MPANASAADHSRDYCARARRLRHVYANRPVELHRELRALAAASDRSELRRIYEPSSKARTYADYLATQIDSPILRYSKRMQLVRSAKLFGIAPFEANLLIAAVQHRQGASLKPTETKHSSKGWGLAILAIAMTQSIVIALAWCALH